MPLSHVRQRGRNIVFCLSIRLKSKILTSLFTRFWAHIPSTTLAVPASARIGIMHLSRGAAVLLGPSVRSPWPFEPRAPFYCCVIVMLSLLSLTRALGRGWPLRLSPASLIWRTAVGCVSVAGFVTWEVTCSQVHQHSRLPLRRPGQFTLRQSKLPSQQGVAPVATRHTPYPILCQLMRQ
ncbi:hypothetical protein F5Y14DRAFT_47712 [Nemania sp. NC0429]|nr:hypothetical protein F5Y14DRAFT_47712 [Nemania sp. NC0429]